MNIRDSVVCTNFLFLIIALFLFYLIVKFAKNKIMKRINDLAVMQENCRILLTGLHSESNLVSFLIKEKAEMQYQIGQLNQQLKKSE